MEENKEVKTGSENIKSTDNKSEKLTYEQLENVAHQLSEQVRQLYAKLQEANVSNAFKRLECLFKVVVNKSNFTESFVSRCTAEIEELMTIPKEDSTTENKDKPEE